MKWVTNDIEFNRGNYRVVIFKFDNSKVWFNFEAFTTTQGIRSIAREMAKVYNAETITMKYLFNDFGNTTENRENVVDFQKDFDEYKFRVELTVNAGERRKFRYFNEKEIFR